MGKILVIADKEQDRSMIGKILNEVGFDKILMAKSGKEGLKEIELEHPDLVVIDNALTDIDSYETCQKIKGNTDCAMPIVVMMTDVIDVKSAEKALEVGVDDFCVKTFNFSILLDVVKKLSRNILRNSNRSHVKIPSKQLALK